MNRQSEFLHTLDLIRALDALQDALRVFEEQKHRRLLPFFMVRVGTF
jgi:hypothetical protein